MEIRLDGMAGMVTGGGSGLGRVIARGLAESGAAVAMADINLGAAEKVAGELRNDFDADALGVKTDVTDRASVEAAVAAVVEKFGHVDILINNAGIAPAFPLVEFPEDRWDAAVDINLKGYFLCAQAVVAQMLRQGAGGNIINVSSKTGLRGSPANAVYSATKFGEIGLAQSWAREFAENNIRVNSVLPGNMFGTTGIWNEEYTQAMADKLGIKPEEVEGHYNRQVPLGRSCTPEDVANLVVFLVSDKASYITGTSILVDGGQEMR